MGASGEVRDAAAVAGAVSGKAQAARSSTALLASHGLRAVNFRIVFVFTITNGQIAAIDILAEPELLGQIDLTILE